MKIVEDNGGTFYITEDGTLEKFVPRLKAGPDGRHPVDKLIIPEGIVKIGTGALDFLAVTEEIRFPESLRVIGTEIWECGISWCDLPDVVIPDGVQEMTSFAFGKCRIRSLRIPAGIRFAGGRHFKGSHIGTLYLPQSCKEELIPDYRNDYSLKQTIQVAQTNNLSIDKIEWYNG